MKIGQIILLIFLLLVILEPSVSFGQCAMCKAQAEQSIEQGSTTARWINAGILYMLFIPYIAVGLIFWRWYRGYKTEQKY
jgi:hypothetical protein